jgi:hypothetical protein
MWFKVYADGSVYDIIHANSADEAIQIAHSRVLSYGETPNDTHWIATPY